MGLVVENELAAKAAPARYFDISMSAASASETSQTGPNTLFIARNAVAMPALRGQKLAAAHVVAFGLNVGELLDQALDLLLVFGLRQRVVFAVGDDLSRHRRTKRHLVRRRDEFHLLVAHMHADVSLYCHDSSLLGVTLE